MTDATVVDVNSKTSLFKRWLVLAGKDFGKWKGSLTSVTNYAFMGLSVWLAVGPYFEGKGAAEHSAKVAQLEADLTNALSRATSAESALGQVKLGYQASQQDNAELAKKNDEMRKQIEAKGEGQKQPLQTASIAPERPKVKRVKTKAVEVPKEEPSTCQQIEACKAFVAWYEANVGTGAN